MQRTHRGETTQLMCPSITLTERWWREVKDLVDIYDPLTCDEYIESDDHPDRYEIDVSSLSEGDTLTLLICKTDSTDQNIIEVSATPSPQCEEVECPPEINCPGQSRLHVGLDCMHRIPDFISEITLIDPCDTDLPEVTMNYTLVQSPSPGTVVTDNQFVEVSVMDVEGTIVATCDIYIEVILDTSPIIDEPEDLSDIDHGHPYPTIQEINARDTMADGSIRLLEVASEVVLINADECEGYRVEYRWSTSDSCGNTAEVIRSFEVGPDISPPVFITVPVELDTISFGEALPLFGDLVAVDDDGSSADVEITKYIEPFEENLCLGYPISYVWEATDSCNNTARIVRTFFVKPVGSPPIFITTPDTIADIRSTEPLPPPPLAEATTASGDQGGVTVTQSVDPFTASDCEPYEVTYRWTARDSCANEASITRSFTIHPDTAFINDMPEMDNITVMVETACTQQAMISIPIDSLTHANVMVGIDIYDVDWNLMESFANTTVVERDFEIGASNVIISIADVCGRLHKDTVTVNAIDGMSPMFECPNTQLMALTDLGTCTATAIWETPTATDNCQVAIVRQISGPSPSTSLSSGTYPIAYEALDGAGNRAVCEFDLVISPGSLESTECEEVKVMLDHNCDAFFQPTSLLSSTQLSCLNNLSVTVIAGLDTLRGDTINLGPYLGSSIRYILCDDDTGICCENDILLESNSIPVIKCDDPRDFMCYQSLLDYRPEVDGVCSPVSWKVSGLSQTDGCSENTFGTIVRTYTAIDSYGNESLPCTTTFTVLPADITELDINGRIRFPGDTTIACDRLDLSATAFGQPYLDSIAIEASTSLCDLSYSFDDVIINGEDCQQTIERRWYLYEPICGGGQRIVEGRQLIHVIDTVAPQVRFTGDIHAAPIDGEHCIGILREPRLLLQDNCADPKSISIQYLIQGILHDNLEGVEVGVDDQTLVVIASDPCGNTSRDTTEVILFDNQLPVAVCLNDNLISLTNGTARLPASSLDQGSYDNCKIDRIEIKRKNGDCSGWPDDFGDWVEFCCEDAGKTIELTLLVTDVFGNQNICHGQIDVRDYIRPKISSCPPDIVVDCDVSLPSDPDSSDPYHHLFGTIRSLESRESLGLSERYLISSTDALLDGYYEDDCPEQIDIIVTSETRLNECGSGEILRTFVAIDQAGLRSQECTQLITILRPEPLDTSRIRWPQSEIFLTTCDGNTDLNKLNVSPPVLPVNKCDLAGVSHDDQVFVISEDDNCLKVIRTWSIIDWCDPANTLIARRSQTIKVIDIEKPQIVSDCAQPRFLYASRIDCERIPINLSLQASDDCSRDEDLRVVAKLVPVDGQGRALVTTAGYDPTNSQYSITETVSPGEYRVHWEVVDQCGNYSECTQSITVIDDKPPTPYAKGISTSLHASGSVTIWASDLALESEDRCYGTPEISIAHSDADFEESGDRLTFTCSHRGDNMVKVFAYRQMEDGRFTYDFTTVVVRVVAASDICDNITASTTVPSGQVSGYVSTSYGVLLPHTMIEMRSSAVDTHYYADDQGFYRSEFDRVDSLVVRPVRQGQIRYGLSTRDAIFIQNHILGTHTLSNPWDLIGADVTQDNRISARDILELRKAVIGKPSLMDQYDAWRFIPANHQFEDPSRAFQRDIPDQITVDLTLQRSHTDFIGIKMGDIDHSVPISAETSKGRTADRINIQAKWIPGTSADTLILLTEEAYSVTGWQLSLDIGQGPIDKLDYILPLTTSGLVHVDERGIRISAITSTKSTLNGNRQLIKLITDKWSQANKSKLKLEEGFQSEIYLLDGSTKSLELQSPIEDITEKAVTFFPNPFRDRLTYQLEDENKGPGELVIYDAMGGAVYRVNTSHGEHGEIDMSDCSSRGVLFYRWTTRGYQQEGMLYRL